MHFLADTSSQPTTAQYGVAVIILLQLSQFLFALLKELRSSQAAKKEDLTALKNELKGEIQAVASEVDDLKGSIEKKLETSRKESADSRHDIDLKVNDNAVKTAALVEGMETLKQTSISTANKVDRLLSRHS